MSIRLLLIDDDRRLHELLGSYFRENAVTLLSAESGADGLVALTDQTVDAVLLDVMMPTMDGLEVLRMIRKQSTVPVLMLTARGDEADRVVGLELGADDYIPKPFSPRELLARVRAVLRRTQPSLADQRLVAGGIEADLGMRVVTAHGERVDLTGLEFDILVTLMRRAGRVVPRASLLSEAGRREATGERTIDVHISKLRKKLERDPASPQLIQTVRGVGYVFARETR